MCTTSVFATRYNKIRAHETSCTRVPEQFRNLMRGSCSGPFACQNYNKKSSKMLGIQSFFFQKFSDVTKDPIGTTHTFWCRLLTEAWLRYSLLLLRMKTTSLSLGERYYQGNETRQLKHTYSRERVERVTSPSLHIHVPVSAI